MSFQALRCMITANDERRFFYTVEEIDRYVEDNSLEGLLWNRDLFFECGARLVRDGIPKSEIRERLYAIFGAARIRRFLGN